MTFNVSFDIDGVVGDHYKDKVYEEYYCWNGTIVSVNNEHYGVPRGYLELIQRLDSERSVAEVICFSSAGFFRNEEFWLSFLKQSLPRKRFQELVKTVRVFSSSDLTVVLNCENNDARSFIYKKKIEPLAGKDKLKNWIHIDDNKNFIFPGEESNVLITNDSRTRVFFSKRSKEKLFYSANQACYVAGLIFQAMDLSQEKSISLSEALLQLQYERKEDETAFRERYKKLQKDRQIYDRGMDELKKVNSELTFAQNGAVVRGDFTSLIQKLLEYELSFRGLWEKGSYDEALQIMDSILDSVERKSGRFTSSSVIVSLTISNLVCQVCCKSFSDEIAIPLLIRILDIPIDSKRDTCIHAYLKVVPEPLKKQSFKNIFTSFWDEKQFIKAFNFLSEILYCCESGKSYVCFEEVLKEIVRPPVRNEQIHMLIKIIKEISIKEVKIYSLTLLLENIQNGDQKIEVFCQLMKQNLKENRNSDALGDICNAIRSLSLCEKTLTSTQYWNVIKKLWRGIDKLGNCNLGVEGMMIIASELSKVEVKGVKNILLSRCYAHYPEEPEKYSLFHKLAVDSSDLYDEEHLFVLVSGLDMIEKRLAHAKALGKTEYKLLKSLLMVFLNRIPSLEGFSFLSSLPDGIDLCFVNIDRFLCSLKNSVKKAVLLAGLAKIYWLAEQAGLSIKKISNILCKENIIEPITHNTSYLIEESVLSLILFQCSYLPANARAAYIEFLEKVLSGSIKEVTLAFVKGLLGYAVLETEIVENVNFSNEHFQNVKTAVNIVRDWKLEYTAEMLNKPSKCNQLLELFRDNISKADLTMDWLRYFLLVEICSIGFDEKHECRLYEGTLGINRPEIRLRTLETIFSEFSPDSAVRNKIQHDLIILNWELKRYKKAMRLLKETANQPVTTSSREASSIQNSFECICKLGVPSSYIPKLLSIIELVENTHIKLLYINSLINSISVRYVNKENCMIENVKK